MAAARQVGLADDCNWDQLASGAEHQDHSEQPVVDGPDWQPRITDEAVDPFLVVAESGLSLEPTGKSGRLQRSTVQRDEREQCQIGQLCEPERRTEPTFEQPTDSAGNIPHACSLPQPASLDQTQIRGGKSETCDVDLTGASGYSIDIVVSRAGLLTRMAAAVCSLLLLAAPGIGGTLDSAFTLAGSNAGQLKAALSQLPAEQRPAAEFLLENMPAVDLAQMSASMLEEDVSLSFKARASLPWGTRVPDDLFRHYVLPYRVTQEPLSNWRGMFFDSLYPLVRNCTTMTDAAMQVNIWTGRKATYKPNAPRDQGPLQTLLSGWGRCEELVILYADACRAIGIPVREAYTPYWTAGDGNHAWPEIWIDGEWYPAHAFEAIDSFHFRFKKDTIRTAYVFAVGYGVPESADNVYHREPGCAVMNVTPDYTPTGLLRVSVTRYGLAAGGVPVCVSVFNSGALRPVARDTTGTDGSWSIPTGVGDVCVTAGSRSDWSGAITRISVGTTTDIHFDLGHPQRLPQDFWLWYPLPKP